MEQSTLKEEAMNNDPMKSLENANPFKEDKPINQTHTAKSALFKEITMGNANENTNTRTKKSSWWSRPTATIPAGLGALAIAVTGVVAINTINTPSALALVTEAAEKTSTADSGRIDVVIDLIEMPDGETGKVKFITQYEGENLKETTDFSELNDTSDDIELTTFETLKVDGVTYVETIAPESFEDNSGPLEKQWTKIENSELLDQTMPGRINSNEINPKAVINLIEQSSDFKESGNKFIGTVKMEALINSDSEALPAGLSILAESYEPGEKINDLPEEVEVKIFLKNGLLSKVTVEIDGDTPDGYTKATITTNYLELGEPQNIVAPPADEVVEQSEIMSNLFDEELPEEIIETQEMLEEFMNSGLCQDVLLSGEPPVGSAPPMPEEQPSEIGPPLSDSEIMPPLEDDFDDIDVRYETCLKDNGRQDVIDALQELEDFYTSEFSEN